MKIKEFYERYWELINFRNEYKLSKIIYNAWDDSNDIEVMGSFIRLKKEFSNYKNPKILDVGAGDRRLEKLIKKMNIDYHYKSLDISKNIQHDYNDINEVSECFDIITMFELIEHLPLNVTLDYFTKSYNQLNKGGIIIVSTPNVEHINQLWKHDVTHIQQYPARDIYSILRMIGFSTNIEVYKINFFNSKKASVKLKLIEKIRVVLNKILGTDYAHGIVVIAKK